MVSNTAGLNGFMLANMAIEDLKLDQVRIATTKQSFGDAYSSKHKMLILSGEVGNYHSVTSLAVCAHELGHALQDRTNNPLFHLCVILQRITRFTNKLIMPVLLVGLALFALGYFNLFNTFESNTNIQNIGFGIVIAFVALFGFNLFYKLITIPMEYRASRLALWYLTDKQLLDKRERRLVKRLLNAAAQTYLSDLFSGIIWIHNKIFKF